MTITRYRIPHVITLWNQLLAHFNTFYPVNIDPLLLLPSLNEPGLDENSWDLVSSFSNSSLVGCDKPFPSGAMVRAYLSFLAVYKKFPHSMDSDNFLWELSYVLDLPWFNDLCKEYCEILNLGD